MMDGQSASRKQHAALRGLGSIVSRYSDRRHRCCCVRNYATECPADASARFIRQVEGFFRVQLRRILCHMGFPSPASDYTEDRLSLDEHLIEHREATFFVTAMGSMPDFGIHNGDILVVDRAIDPVDQG